MAYDIYFDKVLLPVAPSKIKTSIKNKNKSIELINEGEVNLLKANGLTEISFTIMLPNQKYPFARYVGGFKNALYYLNILADYKANKKPFQLIISRTLPNGSVNFYTSMKVSLEDYDIEDDVADGFDNRVTINLKQYKEYGTKTTDISAYVRTTQQPRSVVNNSGKTYTIQSGDTLWNIAKKKLGNGSRYNEIYKLNKLVIEGAAKARGKASSRQGHWIFPNTVIKLP